MDDLESKLRDVIKSLGTKKKIHAHDADKKSLGRALVSAGCSQLSVGAMLGAGQSTVSNWINHKPLNERELEMADLIKSQLANKFAFTANTCLDAITPEMLQKSNVQQLAFAAGISNRNMMELSNQSRPESPSRVMDKVIDVRARIHSSKSDRDRLNSEIQILKD